MCIWAYDPLFNLISYHVNKKNEMLEKLLKDTHTKIELPTSHYDILRAHVAE